METRNLNCTITKPGGNASAGAHSYRVTIPSKWAQAMGITKEDKALIVDFDGEKIVIKKA